MKKFIIFIILIFPFISVNASEIFGNISTNSQSIDNEISNSSNFQEDAEEEQTKQEEKNESPKINFSGNSLVWLINQENKKEKTEEGEEVITLGIGAYADGTLLRNKDKRIYLVDNGFKIYISNLKKLQGFAGQTIYDVTDSELEKYKDKKYFAADLIREQGKAKIFVITNSGLKHILNLEELRLNYFGQEIFNLSREDMVSYE
ncbi:hypothetical protein KAU09_05040 [Candidatus Parcubacteria bacterium]|nr:hypothetical protein [Candidatus Parcubacteria bacterium]